MQHIKVDKVLRRVTFDKGRAERSPRYVGALARIVFHVSGGKVEIGRKVQCRLLKRNPEFVFQELAANHPFPQELELNELVVITSYSIHYTKLYEPHSRSALLPRSNRNGYWFLPARLVSHIY